jgi:hypothetical protein
MNNNLKTYLSNKPKYRLVFDISSSLDVESVDTGAYLAEALQSKVQKKNLNMYASDAIRKMLREHIQEHPMYGQYLAIKNIGILFEPALAFNLETLVEQTAKSVLLIIQARGVVEKERFFFLSPSHNLSISLKSLNYIVIE